MIEEVNESPNQASQNALNVYYQDKTVLSAKAAGPNGGTTFNTPQAVENPTVCEEILARWTAEETFQSFAPTFVTYTNAESESKAFIT